MAVCLTYTDEELVTLLKSGDHAAFRQIYDRYWQKLLNVAANKLKDTYLAEEIVQDIFFDLWKRKEQLNVQYQLSSYLGAALKYKVIDVRRKKSLHDKYLQQLKSPSAAADYSTEQQLSFNELKERLASLVAALPEKCRLVYKLSHEAGYSRKEIAGEMQISEKTVESHLARAIRALRAGLGIFVVLLLFILSLL